jgi:hypothetical protein
VGRAPVHSLEEDTFYLEGLCGDDLPSGLPGETTLLLAALPKEHVAGLTAIGMSLGLATEGVTIRTDGQVLPLNFVPPPLRRSGQWKSRLYRVAAVVLLAGTGARAAWAAYGLYDAREASLQAAAAMTAWRSVAREYGAAQAEKQDAAARRTAWLQAKRRHPSWYGTCLVLARTIPPDCCLTEIVQEEAAEGHGFRIRGEALGSGSIRRFTAALEQERTLADVRLLETGIRQGRQTFSLRFVRTEPEKEGTAMRRCSLSGLGRRLRSAFLSGERHPTVPSWYCWGRFWCPCLYRSGWWHRGWRRRSGCGRKQAGCGSGSRCMPGLLPGKRTTPKPAPAGRNALAWRQKLPDGMQGSALLTALSAEAVRCGVHLDLLRQKQPPVPDGTQTVVTLEGTGPYNGWLRFWNRWKSRGE